MNDVVFFSELPLFVLAIISFIILYKKYSGKAFYFWLVVSFIILNIVVFYAIFLGAAKKEIAIYLLICIIIMLNKKQEVQE